jgi:hypothetical protein
MTGINPPKLFFSSTVTVFQATGISTSENKGSKNGAEFLLER